jgi:catechol 2,3-dioxygenase-like lactoylglutathione lyase family enzyme
MAETQAEVGQGHVGTDQLGAGQVNAGQVNAGQLDAEQPGAEQVSAGQADAEQVSAEQVDADHADVHYGAAPEQDSTDRPPVGAIHHVELWVPNLDRAIASWGWLLTALGYRMFQDWPGGRSWQSGHAYVVVEQSPARTASRHDRCRPGLNHLAFHVPSRHQVDELMAEALLHGWRLMFPDLHPYAGGPQHYAAYLENADGFEVELVAD